MPQSSRPHPIADIQFYTKTDRSRKGELVVYFTTGGSYTYENVPRRVYEEFKAAGSQGTYFNDNIRNNGAYS